MRKTHQTFRTRLIITLVLLTLISGFSASRSLAHGYIVRAIPEDRSTLQRPPTRLQYWFSEELEPRFSEIHLRDSSSSIIASGAVDERNRTLLTLQVPTDLPDGAYIVELRPAFASDGHVVAESRVFFVGEEVGGIEGQSADDTAVPLEVVWRTGMLIANMLIFGVTALYALVLYPAWGSKSHKIGGLPPRVMSRLQHTLIAGLALAFASNILALIQQTMVFFNVDALQVIQGNLWQVVQIGSRFGDVWTFRMVLLIFASILLFVSHYYREMIPQLVRGIWSGLAWLGALLIGLMMITSHAAGSLLLPWVAMAVNWVHSLGVAFWVGGIASLVLVLPVALEPYQGENRRLALLAVMSRFSRMVTLMVLLVIVSGIYNALNWFVTPSDLATTYGSALGLKLLLVALLLFVGGLHHLALHPSLAVRMERIFSAGGTIPFSISQRVIDVFYMFVRQASRFAKLLRFEVLIAVVVLASVALLTATPIPEPEFLKVEIETPTSTQSAGDFTVTSAVIPGGIGVNTYDTVVTRAETPVDDLTIYLQLVNPRSATRSDWMPAEQVETGLYVAVGDDINQTGEWWSLVDIVEADGTITRAVFTWDITESATVLQSRDPQLIHLIALLAVVGVMILIAYPALQRFYKTLNITPLTAFIAVATVGGSLALLLMAVQVVNEGNRRYDESLNPPPTIVNTVLPDAESLARGEALYNQACAQWQPEERDFRSLTNQLDIYRDDALYQATVEGWRDLPPCEGDLSEAQRWDIVNYFRTFEERE